MYIADLSIKRPVLITMIMAMLLLFGIIGYINLPLNLMPQIKIPFVTVQTIYPGAGPTQIETLITKKIEDEIGSISRIKTVKSFSLDSVSIILIEFELGKDPDVANQEVKDKVDAIINKLPDDAETPVIEKLDITAIPILNLVIGGNIDATDLLELVETHVKDSLSRVDGVGRVSVAGGRDREIRVEFDNKVIYENSINLTQVAGILSAANKDMPGGNFQSEGQDFSVRLKGELSSVEELRNLDIPTASGIKKLWQLADIDDSGADVRQRTIFYDNIIDQKQETSILLSVIKSPDGNAVEVAKKVRKILPKIQSELPRGVSLQIIGDASEFIRMSVQDTLGNILMGIGLTALILLFFLHDFRSTLIVAITMPLSIIPTFMVLNALGMSLNVMSLMGLSTAVGVLVMNSVVILENIFRHKEMGHSKKEAASSGTSEVAVAVIAATLTNIAVFVPLANMGGIAGLFLKDFALTVAFATAFSLIVSFTLTPMLASLIIPEKKKKNNPIGAALERMFHSWERSYAIVLEKVLHSRVRSGLLILATVAAFVGTMALFGKIPFEFVPMMDEGSINIKVELPQGYDLSETAALLKEVEDHVVAYDSVKTVVTKLGQISSMDSGTNMAVMNIKLVEKSLREPHTVIAAQIGEGLSALPNARIRVTALGGMGGGEAAVSFYLLGEDITVLEGYSRQLKESMANIDGLINVDKSSKAGKPEITILPYRQKLSDMGISVQELALAMRAAIEGMVMTQYKEGGREYDIRVTLKDEDVSSYDDIRDIAVATQSGIYPISYFADVKITEGINKILHTDKVKSIEFTADTMPGVALGTVTGPIEEAVEGLEMAEGYKLKWAGDAEMMKETVLNMIFVFILAIVLTYMLLSAILEKFGQPVLILSTVPLSLIGVVLAFLITGQTMNIVSMMAIVMLVGMVVNNAILILEYTNQLRAGGMDIRSALLKACPTKLKPILMANIATMLGMLPMALGIGESAAEMRQPMGIVSIGGLITATFLSLFVIPSLENLIESRKLKEKKNETNS